MRFVFAVLAFGAVPALWAQPSVITGRVFDSLRMTPLAGVTVQLARTPLATRTGAEGTYRLVTELRGRRTLTFSEPRLDRIMGTVTAEVELSSGSVAQFDLAIPGRPPAPGTVCPAPPADSRSAGAVVGVVRDSATGLPISTAMVAAYWLADSPDTGGVHRGVKSESGEDGGFLLCGLPTDRPVSLLARTPGREITLTDLRLGADSILDKDLLGRATVDPASLGRLRGRVVDSANGLPLAGADIMLVESGLHGQSNAAGEFQIDQVVPGPTAVVIRHIGHRPEFLSAVLEAGAAANVVARLRPMPIRLPDVESRVVSMERADFDGRMKNGVGKYWDESEIRRKDGGSITSLLGTKASFNEVGGVLINTSRGRKCPVPLIMDGMLLLNENANLRPEQLSGIEFYSGPAQVPIEFQSYALRARGFGCGLLVVWRRGRM